MANRDSSVFGSLMGFAALGVGAAALAACLFESETERSKPRKRPQCMLCRKKKGDQIVTIPRCKHTFDKICLLSNVYRYEYLCPECEIKTSKVSRNPQCMFCQQKKESPIVTISTCKHTFHDVCLALSNVHRDEYLCPECETQVPSSPSTPSFSELPVLLGLSLAAESPTSSPSLLSFLTSLFVLFLLYTSVLDNSEESLLTVE